MTYIEGNQERSSGRNLEAGMEAETMEECSLLACLLRLAQPRTTCPRLVSLTLGWSLIYQSLRKCQTDLSKGQSDEGILSNEVPSYQLCLGLYQVNNKKKKNQSA